MFRHIGRTGILPVTIPGILVEQESWWNRHLACFIFGHLGGMGMLVEQASCLLQLPGRQDAHPTDVHPTLQQCRIFARFPIPDSRFPIPDSRFPLLPKYLLNS